MLKKYVFLFMFPFFIHADAGIAEIPEPGMLPSWVIPYDFYPEEIRQTPHTSNRDPDKTVFEECQYNEFDKELYERVCTQILTPRGVLYNKEISFDFDPEIETLEMYRIRIFRDGKWHDRTLSAPVKMLRQEEELDKGYHGALSLVYFLSDLRVGDIIEKTSCIKVTVVSHEKLGIVYPILMDGHTDKDLDHGFYRFIVPTDPHLKWKIFGLKENLDVRPLSNNAQELILHVKDFKKIEDDDLPKWYLNFHRIEISNYQTWKEAAQMSAVLYPYKEEWVSDEMRALALEWKRTTPNMLSAITCAVRFVQKEINYYSFSEGVKGYIPEIPSQVFKDKFGDCKGKTLLLKAFLHLLGVHSSAVGVSTIDKEKVADTLPMSHIPFDHIILRFDYEGVPYWIDATSTIFNGTLSPLENADYGVGLVYEAPWEDLIKMEKNDESKSIKLKTHCKWTSPQELQLTLSTIYSDMGAVVLRNFIEEEGEEELKDRFRKKLTLPPHDFNKTPTVEIIDSCQDNTLEVKIISKHRLEFMDGKALFHLQSKIRDTFVNANLKRGRQHPYNFEEYFYKIEEEFIIENPHGNWKPKKRTFKKDIPVCSYEGSYEKNPYQLRFFQKVVYSKDYLLPEEISPYCDFIDSCLLFQKAKVGFKAFKTR
jgi:hypothetical protein